MVTLLDYLKIYMYMIWPFCVIVYIIFILIIILILVNGSKNSKNYVVGCKIFIVVGVTVDVGVFVDVLVEVGVCVGVTPFDLP